MPPLTLRKGHPKKGEMQKEKMFYSCFVAGIPFLLLALPVGTIATMLAISEEWRRMGVFHSWGAIGVAIWAWLTVLSQGFLWRLIRWKITPRGIEVISGFNRIGTESEFVPFGRVRLVKVEGGLWAHVMGFRNIHIDSLGDDGAEIEMRGIKDWKRAEAMIRARV